MLFGELLVLHLFSGFKHLLASLPGTQYFEFPDILLRYCEIVTVDDDEVSPFAFFQRADDLFLMGGIGCIQSEGTKRFVSVKLYRAFICRLMSSRANWQIYNSQPDLEMARDAKNRRLGENK